MTWGQLNEQRKEKEIVDIYHVGVNIKFTDGTVISNQKNANLEIGNGPYTNNHIEYKLIPYPRNLDIKLTNFQNNTILGEHKPDHVFNYNNTGANCQDYVLAMLIGNGLIKKDDENYKWIKQDISLHGIGSNIANNLVTFRSYLP